jgi:3-hydroxyacyl-CoA dehydrogenase
VISDSFRLAVLGTGHVGPVIARLAVQAGYPVAIAAFVDRLGYDPVKQGA